MTDRREARERIVAERIVERVTADTIAALGHADKQAMLDTLCDDSYLAAIGADDDTAVSMAFLMIAVREEA